MGPNKFDFMFKTAKVPRGLLVVVFDVGDFELWNPELAVPVNFSMLLRDEQSNLLQCIASEFADRYEWAAEARAEMQ